VELKIFGGIVDGSWSDIDWSAADYFMKVYLDLAGGTDFVEMGTSQLLSVPYAFHAATVATETQELSVNNEQLSISGGNTVDLPNQYVAFQTLSSLKIGTDGLGITTIIEITGTTGTNYNDFSIDLPEGFSSANSRVLSVDIRKNLAAGLRHYCGLGYAGTNGTVGYNLGYFPGLMETPSSNWITLYYPDELKGKEFRVILMKIEK
jgi:hypothetical protein